jgi:peptidoglycan-N-acetylmuramic acid deacetylase
MLLERGKNKMINKNRNRQKSLAKRLSACLLAIALASGMATVSVRATELVVSVPDTGVDADSLDNTTHGWGLVTNTSHDVPINAGSEIFPQYRTYYYVDTDSDDIYLTFDCGYENGNTETILDTLKEHGIKALFFVTKGYLQDNAKLVKRMKQEGHLVGNHTVRHLSTPSLGTDEIRDELNACADYMKEKTGYDMDLYFRPPMGEYSERTLKAVQDMGYTTVLWSMAFYDYDVENQPGASAICEQFMTNYHKGAIPLLHVISQSDADALDSILTEMEEKGFHFTTLNTLADKDQSLRVRAYAHGASDGGLKVLVQGAQLPDTVKVLYYDSAGRAQTSAPKTAGIYYIRAFAAGNSEYRSAVSERVRVHIK